MEQNPIRVDSWEEFVEFVRREALTSGLFHPLPLTRTVDWFLPVQYNAGTNGTDEFAVIYVERIPSPDESSLDEGPLHAAFKSAVLNAYDRLGDIQRLVSGFQFEIWGFTGRPLEAGKIGQWQQDLMYG